MKYLIDTDRTRLARLQRAIDAIEGMPRQLDTTSFGGGIRVPEGVRGYTSSMTAILRHPERAEFLLQTRDPVATRVQGRVVVDGQGPVTIDLAAALGARPPDWAGGPP